MTKDGNEKVPLIPVETMGQNLIENWSDVPTVDDLPAAGILPIPEGMDAPKPSRPEGRAPSDYEREQLDAFDRAMQEIHQGKMRVSRAIYEAVVIVNEGPEEQKAEAEKAANEGMRLWRELCDRELAEAMKAQTLQAFSKKVAREMRQEPLMNSTSMAALYAEGKAKDAKPNLMRR